jgi:UDP-glucuronate 4-epimerase
MILITGHKGFIGSHLIKELDKRGLAWYGYDLVEGNDIRDKRKLDFAFEESQCDMVIHLAALAGVRRGEEFKEDYLSTNVLGTANIIEMCNKYNVKHMILYSSSSVYGEGKPPITEDDAKNPKSFYGMTKFMSEMLLRTALVKNFTTWKEGEPKENRKGLQQGTVVIPFTVYGENGRKDEVVYKWLQQYKTGKPITVFGDGSSERGYVYVKDLVKTTVDILEKKNGMWLYQWFNLGGSEVIKLKELLDLFKKEIKDIKFVTKDGHFADVQKNFANTHKAKLFLGFNPKPQFKSKVRKIIKDELK